MYCFLTEHIENGKAYFDENESRHCLKVLRKGIGENIFFTDGKGTRYQGTIESINKKAFQVEIIETKADPSVFAKEVVMAVALTKQSQRFEWFLEKSTELGVHKILPFYSQHSERKKLNHERSVKIISAAMKQSFQSSMPILGNLQSFKELINNVPSDMEQKFIAIFEGENHIHNQYNPDKSVMLMVGPEGDFSSTEIKEALSNGWEGVHLGSSRLRVETAAVYICSILNAKAQ